MNDIVFERLAKDHDRENFDCGIERYNDFLKRTALQHVRQKTSITWVAVETEGPEILGYITLSMGLIELTEIDENVRRTLPKHPLPVLHIGKLAVDQRQRGKSLGRMLLSFACQQALEVSNNIGCHAVELFADDVELFAHYRRFGFVSAKSGSLRLFLSISKLSETSALPTLP